MAKRGSKNGSKWIRPTTRTRIELRDSYTCVYCGCQLRPGTATLDHVLATELGGSNDPSNLVTSCISCNSAKQDKTVSDFIKYLDNLGVNTKGLKKRVRNATRRALPKLPRGIGDGTGFRRELAIILQVFCSVA